MGKQLQWLNLTDERADADFLQATVSELVDRLNQSIPELRISVDSFASDTYPSVVDHLNLGMAIQAVQQLGARWNRTAHGLIVNCEPDHALAKDCRRRLPHAHWGISFSGVLSVVYAPQNPSAVWHEALHLLGAQDHYDLKTLAATCELPTCIMRYAPEEGSTPSKEFLCGRTKAVLSKLINAV
jgi:hypothetical protein